MAANKVHWWDAPKGYKAIKGNGGGPTCTECEFKDVGFPYDECDRSSSLEEGESSFWCDPTVRKDKTFVIFVKRQEKSKTHTI